MSQSMRRNKLIPYDKDFYHPPKDARRILNNEFLRVPQKQENSIFSDIKMILRVLKVMGLIPIFEKISQYEIAPPTKSYEFYSFFIRGAVHAFTIVYLYNFFTHDSEQIVLSYRDTDNINHWIEIILSTITYTMTIFICGRNSKIFIKIMNEILKVDEEIYAQYQMTLNNGCGFSVKFLVCICICQVYIIGLKIFHQHSILSIASYLLIAFYSIQNCLSTVFIVFASAVLHIIKVRFEYLNLMLTGYTYKEQQKTPRPRQIHRLRGDYRPMDKFPEDSLFAFRMHNKLLRILKLSNDTCALILVGYMGFAFYTITSSAYNIFVQITTGHEMSYQVIQWGFTWLVLHTALLTLLTRSCGQVTKEVNSMSQILARVYGKNKEYQNIVDKFLTKTIRQEVQFSAYGFFIIDKSTLFKIFSAVTTYLVILIQFQQLEDSKTEELSN